MKQHFNSMRRVKQVKGKEWVTWQSTSILLPPGQEIEADSAVDLEADNAPREMVPDEADFVLGYATVPGYVSYRSRSQGSWYVNKLVQMLDRYANRSVQNFITEMSKTFSACQTFGLTNLENLPDRMKTCQTEYKFYIVALLFWNIIKFLAWC